MPKDTKKSGKVKAQEKIDRRRDEFLAQWMPSHPPMVRLWWAFQCFVGDFDKIAPESGRLRGRLVRELAARVWLIMQLSIDAQGVEAIPELGFVKIVAGLSAWAVKRFETYYGFLNPELVWVVLCQLLRAVAKPEDRLPSEDDEKDVRNYLRDTPKLLAALEGCGWFRAAGTPLGYREDGSPILLPKLSSITRRPSRAQGVFRCIDIDHSLFLWASPEVTALLVGAHCAEAGDWRERGKGNWQLGVGDSNAYIRGVGDREALKKHLGDRETRIGALQYQIAVMYQSQANMLQRFGQLPSFGDVTNTKLEVPSLRRSMGKIGEGQSCTVEMQWEVCNMLKWSMSIEYSLRLPGQDRRALDSFIHVGVNGPLQSSAAGREMLAANVRVTEAFWEWLRQGLACGRREPLSCHAKKGVYDMLIGLYLDQIMASGQTSISIGTIESGSGAKWLNRKNDSQRLKRIEDALHRRVRAGLMGGKQGEDGKLYASFEKEDDTLSGLDSRRSKEVKLLPPGRVERAIGPRIELPAAKDEQCPRCRKQVRYLKDGHCPQCGLPIARV